MVGTTHETTIVDLVQSQEIQDDIGPGGSQLAKSNETRVLYTADSGHIIKNKKETRTYDNKNHNEACDLCAIVSGPLIVGLTSPTTATPVTQQSLSPIFNKNVTPGPLKVYTRRKGRKK